MPGGNGLSLLRSLRDIGIRVPIVIITSYADPKVAVEMIQAGASDYIPKSLLTPDGIAQSIRSVVKVRSIEKKRIAAESQLKKVENRLGTIISNTPIILFALDSIGTFRLGLGKHWGDFNPKSGLVIGSSIEHVFEDYPEVIEGFQNSLENGVQKVTAQINQFIFEMDCDQFSA